MSALLSKGMIDVVETKGLGCSEREERVVCSNSNSRQRVVENG